jgi:hypothetical protein
MSRTATQILEDARQLPPAEQEWLLQHLLPEDAREMTDEEFAVWQKEYGEPEPGYDEWFRAGVEEALADTSPGTPHEVAMKHFHEAILNARKLKATA